MEGGAKISRTKVEWDCTLKGVSIFQSSCLLDCQCSKPNPCTEIDDLTSKQLSHSNWPGVQRWESWQAYFSFSHFPSPFMCTTECKLRMNAFKERSSKSVRHYMHFFFHGSVCWHCKNMRKPQSHWREIREDVWCSQDEAVMAGFRIAFKLGHLEHVQTPPVSQKSPHSAFAVSSWFNFFA